MLRYSIGTGPSGRYAEAEGLAEHVEKSMGVNEWQGRRDTGQ